VQSRLLTIREQWLLLGVAGAIVLGAGVLLWRGGAQAPAGSVAVVPQAEASITTSAPTDVPLAGTPPDAVTTQAVLIEASPPEPIAVGILGAVRESGLYYFDPGARVADLLDAAGGALPESDLSDINRTALLMDETTLLVPEFVAEGGRRYSYPATTYNPAPYTRSAWYQFGAPEGGAGNGQTGGPANDPSAAAGGRININTATQGELERLPGIGPATAARIIAHRQTQPFSTPGDLENVSGIGPAKMAAVRDLIAVD